MARDPRKFVKETGRDKQENEQDRELARMTDPATGRIRKDLTRPVKCAACGSDKPNFVFRKQGFDFVKCSICGLVYVNPQLRSDRLIESYEDEKSHNTWVDVLLSPAQIAYDSRNRFGEALRRLERIYPKSRRGRILDIGCSIGLFLKLARDRGWKPFGLEINKKALKHAREVYGLPVEPKLLHEISFPREHFQVISLWGVLEHLDDPAEILRQIRPLLDRQGRLVILVPNVHSLATRIMRGVSPTFGGRNHLWYFSPETLKRLLARTGFTVRETYTQLPQVEELQHFLRFDDPYNYPEHTVRTQEFSLPPKLKRDLERWLLRKNMGYKLIVLASKKGK